jgi:DNA-binding transcriptional regulator YiaG
MESGFSQSSQSSLPLGGSRMRPLHRIAEARRRQGVSLRSVARRLNKSADQVRRLEDPEKVYGKQEQGNEKKSEPEKGQP